MGKRKILNNKTLIIISASLSLVLIASSLLFSIFWRANAEPFEQLDKNAQSYLQINLSSTTSDRAKMGSFISNLSDSDSSLGVFLSDSKPLQKLLEDVKNEQQNSYNWLSDRAALAQYKNKDSSISTVLIFKTLNLSESEIELKRTFDVKADQINKYSVIPLTDNYIAVTNAPDVSVVLDTTSPLSKNKDFTDKIKKYQDNFMFGWGTFENLRTFSNDSFEPITKDVSTLAGLFGVDGSTAFGVTINDSGFTLSSENSNLSRNDKILKDSKQSSANSSIAQNISQKNSFFSIGDDNSSENLNLQKRFIDPDGSAEKIYTQIGENFNQALSESLGNIFNINFSEDSEGNLNGAMVFNGINSEKLRKFFITAYGSQENFEKKLSETFGRTALVTVTDSQLLVYIGSAPDGGVPGPESDFFLQADLKTLNKYLKFTNNPKLSGKVYFENSMESDGVSTSTLTINY